ncbi:MAG: hypothetical protein GYA62_02925, partial [Bacteroidales bacterium]|nr:hypothetical protein [Bacteroidales bacterium]
MKKNNQRLYHLLGLSLIILIVFRNLITSLQSNLIDWRDYAYITWVINQNITHLRLLDFANIFNQNAFYPYTNTIFLSDTLFTQSIIGLPFSFISKNPVAIFNSVFIITIFLNSLSSYIFWKNIFHNCTIGFVGSLACVFSPIFFTQLGHFQMLSYWPFFLSLHLAFKSNVFINKKVIFTLGVLLSIQFLASVYLAVFLGVTLFIYFLVHTLSQKKIRPILSFLIVILIFILLDSLFIKGYLNT